MLEVIDIVGFLSLLDSALRLLRHSILQYNVNNKLVLHVLWHCRAGLLKSGLAQMSHDVELLKDTLTNT